MIVLAVGVNALTASIIIRYLTSGEENMSPSPEEVLSANVTEAEDTSVFGRPDKITVSGFGSSVTLTPSDEEYEEILRLNELRCIYTLSFQRALIPMEDNSKTYHIEYTYDKPHLIDRTKEPISADMITFSLTGKSHGIMRIASGDEFGLYGKLAVEPELILLVTEILG